jgi:tripartite-type tricarboxylate transporter receptor subunit TctC
MIHRRDLLRGAASLPFAGAAFARADAQEVFPVRPVTVVVPYPAGGSVDIVARALGEQMSRRLKQSVVIENRSGSSGSIAALSVATAEPDGYRIVLGTQQTHGTNEALLPNLGYRAVDNFAPICSVCTAAHVLVVKRGLPAANAAELVTLLKREPGKFNYGSTGNGSSSHLAGEMFKMKTSEQAQHIPYRGGPPLAQDLAAGTIDFSLITVANIVGQIHSGLVKPLAVASPSRVAALPDVPTLAEAGLPAIDADAWFAYFSPAHTPASRMAAICLAVEYALGQQPVKEILAANGLTQRFRRIAEMPEFVASEVRKWAEVVKVSGAKADL